MSAEGKARRGTADRPAEPKVHWNDVVADGVSGSNQPWINRELGRTGRVQAGRLCASGVDVVPVDSIDRALQFNDQCRGGPRHGRDIDAEDPAPVVDRGEDRSGSSGGPRRWRVGVDDAFCERRQFALRAIYTIRCHQRQRSGWRWKWFSGS